MKTLWIVGRLVHIKGIKALWKRIRGKNNWHFSGIFENKIEAIKHAISRKDENHFVGLVILNEKLSEKEEFWTDLFFPQILKLWYDYSEDPGEWDLEPKVQAIAILERDNILKAYKEIVE